MSRLVERRIKKSGLAATSPLETLLGGDLLALGALADRACRAKHGDRIRIGRDRADLPAIVVRAGESPAEAIRALASSIDSVAVRPDPRAPATGEEILRAAATCRLASGAHHVAIAWEDVGIELAQVALSFGVDELLGPVTEGALLTRGIPRAELEDLVRKAGREAA